MPKPPLDKNDIREMLDFLSAEFKTLRSFILNNAGKVEHISKEDGSPQTEIDIAVEERIFTAFKSRYSNVDIFGEETGYSTEDVESFWLIDPIDGTASYLENIPTFTCMAVLIQNEQPTACVIYNPTSDDTFMAMKGEGARKNGQLLSLATLPLPNTALAKGRYKLELDTLLAEEGVECEIGQIGAGYGFCKVAEGGAAARFMLNSTGYPHDYATGALLVSEAGGAVIPLDGKDFSCQTTSFIVCHPALTNLLLRHRDKIRQLELSLG